MAHFTASATAALIGLAHFERHEVSEFFFVAFEDLGGLQHASCALGERSFKLGVESGDGKLKFLLDFVLERG